MVAIILVAKDLKMSEDTSLYSTVPDLNRISIDSSVTGNNKVAGFITPGQVIRPKTTDKLAIRLMKELYGLSVESVKELVSYDDRNYHVKVQADYNNLHLKDVSEDGYVLKILNSVDSATRDLDVEHCMMSHLRERGFCVPLPVSTLDGNFTSTIKIYDDGIDFKQCADIILNGSDDRDDPQNIHLVRLLQYIPGTVFKETPYTPCSFYHVGKYAGKLTTALQGFSHPGLVTAQRMWDLRSVPKLVQFAPAIQDKANKILVYKVIEAFNKEVVSLYGQLEKGAIYGDLNETNILMELDSLRIEPNSNISDKNTYKIKGIIDFGDCCDSCKIFELAIPMVYMIVDSPLDPITTGGHVIAGYQSERSLTETEWDVLRVCVLARLAQSLTMGEYMKKQDPHNKHIFTLGLKGWRKFWQMWEISKDETMLAWKKIICSYED